MRERPDLDPKQPPLLDTLAQVSALHTLNDTDRKRLAQCLSVYEYEEGEPVFERGDLGTHFFIVAEGLFALEQSQKRIKIYQPGDLFGEIAILDEKPRTATVHALAPSTLLAAPGATLADEALMPPSTAAKIYCAMGRLVSSYIREENNFYTELDVLLFQDGGCAPGYNPVTGFLSQYFEREGRNVFICAQGFKSLVRGLTEDFRCLMHDAHLFAQFDHIPGVISSAWLREARGADFRTERYKAFREPEKQQQAAQNIIDRNVKVLIGIGGNGTFAGLQALSRYLPPSVQLGFIPATIDSDVYGTECLGQHTGVEVGAEKIRSYMADARTHHRIYIIEMMGAQGGYHALHSCLGAGADLAVLPSSSYDLDQVAEALQHRTSAVVVVAEGYKRTDRKAQGFEGNAAEYFRHELLEAGLNIPQRVICEGFSRDIRGAAPNNRDITLAQQMAKKLTEEIIAGRSHIMPAVLAEKEGVIPFDEIHTDNSVLLDLAELANTLNG